MWTRHEDKEFTNRVKEFSNNYQEYLFKHCLSLHYEYMNSEHEITRKLLHVTDEVTIYKEYEEDSKEHLLGLYSITEFYNPDATCKQEACKFLLECDCAVAKVFHTRSDNMSQFTFSLNGNRGGMKCLFIRSCNIDKVVNLEKSGLKEIECDTLTLDALRYLDNLKIKTTYSTLYWTNAIKSDILLLARQKKLFELSTDYVSFCLLVKNFVDMNLVLFGIRLTLPINHRELGGVTREEILDFLAVYFLKGGISFCILDEDNIAMTYTGTHWAFADIGYLGHLIEDITPEDIIAASKSRSNSQ